MTEKAEKILKKIKRRKPPIQGVTEKILDEFNKSTLDDSGPVVRGDQEMKVLREMNELQHFENENWSRGSV